MCIRDSTQVKREVHQQLVPSFFGEEVDDAVDGLIGAVGMQGGEAQVAGLGEGNRVVHCFPVADFSHQDDVGGLTQGVLQRGFP